MKKIKLLNKSFEFRKSAYSYKDFEDRNKRPYNPTLSSDILDYLYSCIVAGYFYLRQNCPIDHIDFYDLIDQMEEKDPELLYKDNKALFGDLLGLKQIEEPVEESDSKSVKKKK